MRGKTEASLAVLSSKPTRLEEEGRRGLANEKKEGKSWEENIWGVGLWGDDSSYKYLPSKGGDWRSNLITHFESLAIHKRYVYNSHSAEAEASSFPRLTGTH